MASTRRFRFHLSTALIAMMALSAGLLVYLRHWAWFPEHQAMTEAELEARFPGWAAKDPDQRSRSPDGTRVFNTLGPISTIIYDSSGKWSGLFSFTIRDHSSEFQTVGDGTPIHSACGFVDDNHCVMVFADAKKSASYRVWQRRFPEWWWGHLYRPEVWAAGVLVLLTVWLLYRDSTEHRPVKDSGH